MTTPATIDAFGRRLRARETTAVEMTEACLRAIETANPRLNAFILVLADQAREQACDADRELAAGRDRGPLHGVPISVKDILDIRGMPTTAASRVRDGHLAAQDAPAVERLRQAGAVLIGKTNLHEFALGTTSEDSAFGPVRNPHDPARSPGGSSGGSAVSIVAGMALASVGTDTGGSIRIPSAVRGVVGRSRRTARSRPPGWPRSRTLDHVGPPRGTSRYDSRLSGARRMRGASSTRCSRRARGPAGQLRKHFATRSTTKCGPDSEGGDGAGKPDAGGRGGKFATRQDRPPRISTIGSADAGVLRENAESMCRIATPLRCGRGWRWEGGSWPKITSGALICRDLLTGEVDAASAGHDALILPTAAIPAPLTVPTLFR